jgi:hypothetical protein
MAKKDKSGRAVNKGGGPVGFTLFLAWIGAIVYFVQNSAGFWGFILAILKACVWPAFVLHRVLQILNI